MSTQKNNREAQVWKEGYKAGVISGSKYILDELQKILDSKSSGISVEEMWSALEKEYDNNPYS